MSLIALPKEHFVLAEEQVREILVEKLRYDVFCPHSACAFVADHACAHRLLGSASFHEHGASAWLDFADDDEVALAAEEDVSALFNSHVVLDT